MLAFEVTSVFGGMGSWNDQTFASVAREQPVRLPHGSAVRSAACTLCTPPPLARSRQFALEHVTPQKVRPSIAAAEDGTAHSSAFSDFRNQHRLVQTQKVLVHFFGLPPRRGLPHCRTPQTSMKLASAALRLLASSALTSVALTSAVSAQDCAVAFDINQTQRPFDGQPNSRDGRFVQSGSFTYFWAITPQEGQELWRTDGTATGTILLRDITPGPGSASDGFVFSPGNMVACQIQGVSHLFFAARSIDEGYELWITDGTTSGTRLVRDIYPGSDGSRPSRLTAGTGVVFFLRGRRNPRIRTVELKRNHCWNHSGSGRDSRSGLVVFLPTCSWHQEWPTLSTLRRAAQAEENCTSPAGPMVQRACCSM